MKYINEFLEYIKVIKKHSNNTIENYRIDLINFYEYTNKQLLEVSKEDISTYISNLYKNKLSKSYIARKLTSLRMFYNYLLEKEYIDKNYFLDFKNPKKDKLLPKVVKENDIENLFSIPNINSPYGQRNLLIIRLMYATGMRISELINVKIKDINIKERTIKVFGKGAKERIVVFGNNTKEILELYLNDGRNYLNIKNSEYVFLNKNGKQLSVRYIRMMINDLIAKAGIDIHINPHMLRHTFATEMLNNGADLVSVKDLLGHESLNTTTIYTHVSNEKIKEIYINAHPRAKNRR